VIVKIHKVLDSFDSSPVDSDEERRRKISAKQVGQKTENTMNGDIDRFDVGDCAAMNRAEKVA